jgi:hypothetical protein
VAFVALPAIVLFLKGYIVASATRADDAPRPTACYDVLAAIDRISEVDDCLLKGERLHVHEYDSDRWSCQVYSCPSFLRKEWPQRELDGLVAREIDGVKVILPVWHKTTREQIVGYSPILADRLAASSDRGIDHVVEEILRAIEASRLLAATPAGNGRNIQAADAQSHSSSDKDTPSGLVSASSITDLWVNSDYPLKLGILDRLKADGYDLKWERAIDEAVSIDLEGWEYVIVERADKTRVRLKVKDAPIVGGYVVLLKRRKAR